MISTLQKDALGNFIGLMNGRVTSKRRLSYLGLASSLLILIGSLSPTSPFTSKVPGSWFFGMPGGLVSLTIIPGVLAQALFYIGALVGIVAWVILIRSVLAKQFTTREIVGFAVLWFPPLLLAGPLYSKDIYSYAAIGEMVSRHISPYLYGPNILGATPYLNTVDPFWGNAPAPYGPLFLWFAGFAATITVHNPFATMLLLRVAAIIAVIVSVFCVVKLAELSGKDRNLTLVLVGLNPLVVFHLASSGHNDAFMIAFVAVGLLALRHNYRIVGVVLISLGASIKIPAILAVAFVAWSASPGNNLKSKLKPSIFYGVVSIATLGISSLVTGIGWGWLSNLGTPGTVRSPAVPTTILADWSYRLSSIVGIPLHVGGWLTLYRGLGFLLAAVVGLFFVFRSDKYTIEKAIGYSFLALVLLGPVIQPWYIAWGLILVASRPTYRTAVGVVAVSIAGMLLGLPDGPMLVSWTGYILLVSAGLVFLANRLGFRVLPANIHGLVFEQQNALS